MPRTLGLVRVDMLVGLLEVTKINWVSKVRLLASLVSGHREAAQCHGVSTMGGLTNRWPTRILHYRFDGVRTLSNIRYETTSRRLPMARCPHCRLLPLVQVVQDEEWFVPIRTLVLDREIEV